MRALLLPGLDGSGKLFTRFAAALPSSWCVEIVRYPSDRPLGYDALEADLRASRFASGSPPTLVIAESFSGPLAIRLAADPPPSLRGVVLVASFASPPVPGWLARLAARWASVPPTLAVRIAMIGLRGDPAVARLVREAMAELGPGVAATRLRALGEIDVRTQLAAARVPLAILRASHDRLVPARALRAATSVEHVVEGPHLLLQINPSACAERIVEFADGLARESG